MEHHNRNEKLKVGNDAGKGRTDTVKDRRMNPKRDVRQRSLRSMMKFSSIDEESDQSQRMEGSNIDHLSVSAKFTSGENDQSLLRPMRQQSVNDGLFDVSERSLGSSDKFSVASSKFRLPEDANMPIYCPMRQVSHNMNFSLNEMSAFGSSDIGDSNGSSAIGVSSRSSGIGLSSRSSGIGGSYRSTGGIEESDRSMIASELCGKS